MTYIDSKDKDTLNELFGLPLFQTGVDYYKMTYTSKDAKGEDDVLSGLVVIPEKLDAIYPLVVYAHGTSSCKTCVPSRWEQEPGGDEGLAGMLFGGLGFVTLMPDYVGMGDGNGFQTYVHKETSISALEDMRLAFKDWALENEVKLNDQLFINGYSQGGYAAMAYHQYMQETYGEESVTAAAHNAGPYSLSGVMRDLILIDSAYQYPAYIPNTFLGMNEVLELFDDLEEFFKPAYVPDIELYYNGEIELIELNARIIDSLESIYGASVAGQMIKDEVFAEIENNPDHFVNELLRDNDVLNWAPKSPTRLFYCKADDQVPYKNSLVAIDSMYALGADPEMVFYEDLDSTLTHEGCVEPAFFNTVFFFAGLMESTLDINEIDVDNITIYPNPVSDKLYFKGEGLDNASVSIWDMSGREVLLNHSDLVNGIDVSSYKNGLYIIQLDLGNGNVLQQRIIVSN